MKATDTAAIPNIPNSIISLIKPIALKGIAIKKHIHDADIKAFDPLLVIAKLIMNVVANIPKMINKP